MGTILFSKLFVSTQKTFWLSADFRGHPTTLPHEYHEFADVFCKQKAEVLPLHGSFNSAINFIPEAPLPKGRTYPLSLLKQKSMEENVKKTTWKEVLSHPLLQ